MNSKKSPNISFKFMLESPVVVIDDGSVVIGVSPSPTVDPSFWYTSMLSLTNLSR